MTPWPWPNGYVSSIDVISPQSVRFAIAASVVLCTPLLGNSLISAFSSNPKAKSRALKEVRAYIHGDALSALLRSEQMNSNK